MADQPKKNFFVSYNKADRVWAEWIAWQLEAEGYTTVVQAWDFLPGSNFILEMDKASRETERTIAVLSPDYLAALFTQPEWAEAFRRDPKGKQRTLVPVRVRLCEPTGLFGAINYVDLVEVSDAELARARILSIVGSRAKPSSAPSFPGSASPQFPGAATAVPGALAEPRAAWSRLPADAPAGVDPRSEIESLLERVRVGDRRLAEAIQYCAISRRLDAEIVGVLRGAPDDRTANEQLLAGLAALPFVERRDGALVYREAARAHLLSDWRQDSRADAFDEYNSRLVTYYNERHEAAQGLEQDLARVAGVIQEASRARYAQLSDVVDKALLSPLRESLYHETLGSLDRGYSFFTEQYQEYETKRRLSICRSLIDALREAIGQVPAVDDTASTLVWLEYWEARLFLSLGQDADADARLREVGQQAGDDVVLQLWILNDRGRALQGMSRLREAHDLYKRALAMSRETGADPFNRPVWDSQIASLLWSLDELEDAERKYRDTIQSAREADNQRMEADAMLCLSGVYLDLGNSEQSIKTAFDAMHLVRSRHAGDYGLQLGACRRFMALMARHDPRLLDTLVAEARALADLAEPLLALELRDHYANCLRESGQLRRAEEQLRELGAEEALESHVRMTSDVLGSRAELAAARGDLHEAIAQLGEVLRLSEGNPAAEWQRAVSLSRRAVWRAQCGQLDAAEMDAAEACKVWNAIGHERKAVAVQVTLADIARRRGRIAEALALLDLGRAVEVPYVRADHTEVDAHLARDRGNLKAARDLYLKALAVNRGRQHWQAAARNLTDLAAVAASLGDWQGAADGVAEAREIWRRVSDVDRNIPSPATLQADAENARGLRHLCASAIDAIESIESPRYLVEPLRLACDAFRLAIERNPRNVWYYLNLGYGCAAQADWGGAAAALQRALAIAREEKLDWLPLQVLEEQLTEHQISQSEVLQESGDRSMKLGRAREALEHFERALQLVPSSAADVDKRQGDIHSRIGLARCLLNETKASRTMFSRAIRLYVDGNISRPGEVLGIVCRTLLPNVDAYWTLDAEWSAYAESERRDRNIAHYLRDARQALVAYLDDLYHLRQMDRPLAPLTRVLLDLGSGLIPEDTGTESWPLFTKLIPQMRARISAETGAEVPGVRVRQNDNLAPGGYLLSLDEIPVDRGAVVPGAGYCPQSLETLKARGIAVDGVVEAPSGGRGRPGCWIPADRCLLVAGSGLEIWTDPLEYAVRHLETVLRRNLADFVGLEETGRLLTAWRATEKGPSLVDAVLPDSGAQFRFGRLLRALTAQRIPITDWTQILKTAQRVRMEKSSLAAAVQAVRLQVRNQLPGNDGRATRVDVPTEWEPRLAGALRREGARRVLQLAPADAHRFLVDIRTLVKPQDPDVVLVCRSPDLRPFIQSLLEPEFPDVPVLAAEEVVTGSVRPDGRGAVVVEPNGAQT